MKTGVQFMWGAMPVGSSLSNAYAEYRMLMSKGCFSEHASNQFELIEATDWYEAPVIRLNDRKNVRTRH